jgi:ABC-type dipeptide/oligopeptide/nickel transport system permease subunit
MSLLGNVVVIGSVLACVSVPQMLRRAAPSLVSSENWWALAPAALAMVVYVVSLRSAGTVFSTRRERVLAAVEGKA